MTGECLRFGECFITNTDEGYVAQLGDLETQPHVTALAAALDLAQWIEGMRVPLLIRIRNAEFSQKQGRSYAAQ